MLRVFVIPHYDNEMLFGEVAARCNSAQGDFKFSILPPDEDAASPLSKFSTDYKKILSYLAEKKHQLGAKKEDLIIALFDGRLDALKEGWTNLFMAGANIEEQFPCTAVISMRFISWGILEKQFDYDLQKHAVLHLMICGLLGAYTKTPAHPETFGCLLDFNLTLTSFNKKLQRGYYLCSDAEKGCRRKVLSERYGNSIVQLCSTLKYNFDLAKAQMTIGSIMIDNSNRSVSGRFSGPVTVTTGDGNIVSTATTHYSLPPPATVNAEAELAALREILKELHFPDRGKYERALEDASDEIAKATPDKEEAAGAIQRAIKYAKMADDFGQHATNVLPHILALGSWLGEHGRALLALAGIAI